MTLKRVFTICLAATLLVGSLLFEKIAKAAEEEKQTKNYQESSDMGPMPVGSPQASKSFDSSDSSDGSEGDGSSSEPTPEQMKKRQQIIVY